MRGDGDDPFDFDKFAREISSKAAHDVSVHDELAAAYNAGHFVSHEGGNTFVYREVNDPTLQRRRLDRMTTSAFKTLYQNCRVPVGNREKSVADIWLTHPKRRTYVQGVVFDPSEQVDATHTYNLWRGYAIEPAVGDWSLLRNHIRDVICKGDEAVFDYLLGWIANMIQNPAQQGEVAVVMRGGEGTGKGTLARALTRVIGQHALAVSNAKHLVGNFNAHLRDCIFLFADEAFYAGDKQHTGVLKSLITEPTLTIEAKYQNAVQTPNYLHLMIASNEEWVIPAAIDARRFLMLEVGESHKNDHDYFGAIWQQMEAGGYAAMLHDLLRMDLSGFNLRKVPKTDALQTQKDQSLPVRLQWWQEVLYRGYVYESELGLEEYFDSWRSCETTDLLYLSYLSYSRKHGDRHPMSRVAFGRFITHLGGRARNLQSNRGRKEGPVVGEHRVQREGSAYAVAELLTKKQAPGYEFGSLETARKAFEQLTSMTIDWPPVEE